MKKYGELTSAELSEMEKEKTIVFIPIGSIEAHGAHLPLLTDFYQAESVCLALASRFNALLAPPIFYGHCSSTKNFPGTISLSTNTLRSLIQEILFEFARNGFKNFVIISGHAGNAHMEAIREAAKALVDKDEKIKIMVLSDYEIAYELRGVKFPEDDGHGGLIETSRMLAIRPELVKINLAKPGKNRIPRFMVLKHPEKYWDGFTGEPQKAKAELGREINEYILEKLSELIKRNFEA